MKTSYFSAPGIAKDPDAVSIARYAPRWWGPGRRYIALAPSADLLKRAKAGLPWEDYVRKYNHYLETLDPQKIWADLKDKTLCCYERPGENCHRHLVAAWMEKELGVTIPEK